MAHCEKKETLRTRILKCHDEDAYSTMKQAAACAVPGRRTGEVSGVRAETSRTHDPNAGSAVVVIDYSE